MHNFNPMLFLILGPKFLLPPDELIITCINIFLYILPGMYVCVLTQIKEDMDTSYKCSFGFHWATILMEIFSYKYISAHEHEIWLGSLL